MITELCIATKKVTHKVWGVGKVLWSKVEMKSKPTELPKCTSVHITTTDGDYYDCEAEHDRSCEDCLCNFHSCGGLWNPKTGKKMRKTDAIKRFGSLEREK